MARACFKGVAFAALILFQPGVTLLTLGQSSASPEPSAASESVTSISSERNDSARSDSIRILRLPEVQPILEDITLQILADN